MAYTDWVFEESSSGIVPFIDIFNPVFGTGSLIIEHDSDSGSELFTNGYNTTYVGGILKGKIRTLIQPVTLVGASTYLAGCVFMQSQNDLTKGSGSSYGAFYTANSGGTTTRFTIFKYNSGLVSALGGTSLYTGPSLGTFGPGTTSAMEIEWDATSGTQVDMTLRRAMNDTDFGNMVVETAVSDTISPLLSTVYEGISTINDAASDTSWKYDSTSIFTLL